MFKGCISTDKYFVYAAMIAMVRRIHRHHLQTKEGNPSRGSYSNDGDTESAWATSRPHGAMLVDSTRRAVQTLEQCRPGAAGTRRTAAVRGN
jgi:hypothetical protein